MDRLNPRLDNPPGTEETEKAHIYHDIKDDEKEYAYAYAHVKSNSVPDDTRGKHDSKGLIVIHPESEYEGLAHEDKNHYPSHLSDYAYAYSSKIRIDPIAGEHVNANSVTIRMPLRGNHETEAKHENEGWKDNEIYVTESNDEVQESQEGWADNQIYADSDKVSKVKGDRDEDEGWEDNVVYASNGK